MLKYVYAKQTFAEVPHEICLCIELSGCTIHCPGCHSPELWGDNGTELSLKELARLVGTTVNSGISCICIMGGEDFTALNKIFMAIKCNTKYKTCWYTGLDNIPKEINLANLDYIKIGHFNGTPITDPNTNQRFYKLVTRINDNNQVIGFDELEDITNEFWNNKM